MTPDWTAQLAPAHAPPPPGWWPPAPGLVDRGGAAARAIAVAVRWWRDPYRRSRRAALRELALHPRRRLRRLASARAIESLLRRFAIAVFGGARVARLTGDAWLRIRRGRGRQRARGRGGPLAARGRVRQWRRAATASVGLPRRMPSCAARARRAPAHARGETLMFHLAWPWMALLLPLAVAVAPDAQGRRAGRRGGVSAVRRRRCIAARRDMRHCHAAQLALLRRGLGAAGVGARCARSGSGEPLPVPTSGRQIMLAIDCSGSMASQDMAGGERRLQVVQTGCRPFHRPPPRRSGRADPLRHASVPAGAALGRHRDRPPVSERGRGGRRGHRRPRSATPSGLRSRSCVSASSTGGRRPCTRSVLILLTDGGNDAGVMPPLEAAKLAAQIGLRIYTIGVGAAEQHSLFGAQRRQHRPRCRTS